MCLTWPFQVIQSGQRIFVLRPLLTIRSTSVNPERLALHNPPGYVFQTCQCCQVVTQLWIRGANSCRAGSCEKVG